MNTIDPQKAAQVWQRVRGTARLSDRELTAALADAGIRVRALSEYYHEQVGDLHCLVVNYAGIREDALEQALAKPFMLHSL